MPLWAADTPSSHLDASQTGYASSAHQQAVDCQGARVRRRRRVAEPISRPTNGVKRPGRRASALPTQVALSSGLPPLPYLPCHIESCWASIAALSAPLPLPLHFAMSINDERSISRCCGSRYQTRSNGKLRIANSDNKSPPTPSSAAPYNLFKQGEQAKIAGHQQLKGNMAPDPLTRPSSVATVWLHSVTVNLSRLWDRLGSLPELSRALAANLGGLQLDSAQTDDFIPIR
ncbi:hypothetical protein B0H34DRAFT_679862 [Crassisporium funariophilum]|nr:hypothetical protein B0H34DRAFT_679862 [Crassisporium funariophilum]